MTQEEKNLLLKDLSARLPYGAIIEGLEHPEVMTVKSYAINEIMSDPYKPYLRPMSSMSEDEKAELLRIADDETKDVIEQIKNNDCGILDGKYHFNRLKELDWLNAHHFDYRGLIDKGLALEAPKDMYNF